MNRLTILRLRRTTVAVMFVCLSALTLCQVLAPTAHLKTSFSPNVVSVQAYAIPAMHVSGGHIAPPSRCAGITLAPIEIKTIDLSSDGAACDFELVASSAPPPATELGVPTPPPRAA